MAVTDSMGKTLGDPGPSRDGCLPPPLKSPQCLIQNKTFSLIKKIPRNSSVKLNLGRFYKQKYAFWDVLEAF